MYPAKAVRIVIGFPPGSTPDIVTRILADKMGEDSTAGACRKPPWRGRLIAVEAVARAPADGYTLNVDGCSAAGIVYAFVMTGTAAARPIQGLYPRRPRDARPLDRCRIAYARRRIR